MTSATIHAIFIRGHEHREGPKPHTVYRIEVQGPVRSWTVWRRYSEFLDLQMELVRSTDATPPAELPPKHTFSLRRTFNEPRIIEERLQSLEKYLRAILGNKDPRWRDSLAFKDFLSMPNSGTASTTPAPVQFSSSSWLDEHSELQSLIRDIRSDINRRNSLADTGDISASHQSNVQAKKQLATLLNRIGILARGLDDLAAAGMSEGELQRRGDMISRLQDECEKLAKMVIASRQSTRPFASNSAAEQNPAAPVDRQALLGSAASSPPRNFRPVARVFGSAALETNLTRPLDEGGLVQLQQTQMDTQDSQLQQLSSILQRQKQIGVAIGSEIAVQNEMLDRLTVDVDRVGGKLAGAKKQMNRLG